MPQYFSAIRGIAKEEDDPHGRILPNDAAALSYAEFAIAQLQKERGYDVCTGWSGLYHSSLLAPEAPKFVSQSRFGDA